jgi:hypothetical protein
MGNNSKNFKSNKKKDVLEKIAGMESTFTLIRKWIDVAVLTEGENNMTELEEILKEMEEAIKEAERIIYHSHLVLLQGGKC